MRRSEPDSASGSRTSKVDNTVLLSSIRSTDFIVGFLKAGARFGGANSPAYAPQASEPDLLDGFQDESARLTLFAVPHQNDVSARQPGE